MNVSRLHLIGDYTNNIAYKARHKFVDTSTDCTILYEPAEYDGRSA